MVRLTKKQREMLDGLESRRNEMFLYHRGIELHNGHLWRTARALMERGLVQVFENENGQYMAYLPDGDGYVIV